MHWSPERRAAMVAREPISVGIALITGFEAVTGAAIGFGAASMVGSIAIGATVLGANYALAAINKPKVGSVAASINGPETRGNINQSAPTERWIYGRARCGGAVFFFDDSKPPYLYLGMLYSGRQISAVRGVRISTNDIVPNTPAFDQVLTPLAIDGQYYIKGGASRLWMSFGAGRDDQAIDPILTADFPNLDPSFRQRGISRGVFKFKFGDDQADFERLWGQGVSIPNPLIDFDGAPVYDPRDPNQFYPSDWRDAAEVAAAMATWKFRRTAALIQADWLGHPSGVNNPRGRIRWDEVARAADFDDEPVANKDGTSRPRHTIDGVVTLDQSPRTVMEAMLTANRGFVVRDRGWAWPTSSAPLQPVMTIDDNLLLGGFEFQADRAKSEKLNSVAARFAASDREYQEIDGPPLIDDDLIAEDGEVLQKSVRLPMTSDFRAVELLEKQYVAEARLKRSLTCVIKVMAAADGIRPGVCVQVWSELPYGAKINGLYRVETMGFLDDFSGLSVSLREYDPLISIRWNPATDERDFTLPDLKVS